MPPCHTSLSQPPPFAQTVVIGAGLSGLTAAHQISQAGFTVQVLESEPVCGGLIQSRRSDGFTVEGGATTFPSTATELLSLCDTLGLKPQPVDAQAKHRFIGLNHQLVPLPLKPLQAIGSSLLSTQGKLRILAEPFISACQEQDISIASFFRKRLGTEVLDTLVDPFIGGIYAGDVEQLSLPAVFPKLWSWEQTYGSIVKGALAQRKKSKTGTKKPMTLYSFSGGLAALPTALASALPKNSIRTNCPVHEITLIDNTYHLKLSQNRSMTCKFLILATPAHVSATLLKNISSTAQDLLNQIPYNALAVQHFGFSKTTFKHPLNGFGMLIPQQAQQKVLGTIFASSLFPDRAPHEQILLSSFVGGAHNPNITHDSDESIGNIVLQELSDMLKTENPPAPSFQSLVRYTKAIPQYTLGHVQRIQKIQAQLSQLSRPTVYLCGNYLNSIALNGCVQSGITAANAIIQQVSCLQGVPSKEE